MSHCQIEQDTRVDANHRRAPCIAHQLSSARQERDVLWRPVSGGLDIQAALYITRVHAGVFAQEDSCSLGPCGVERQETRGERAGHQQGHSQEASGAAACLCLPFKDCVTITRCDKDKRTGTPSEPY